MNNIPKISVVAITYNQEDVIRRTLDSYISQREWLYEICVCDDRSTDGTYDILKEYQQAYPDLLKIHRNEVNVGIFENVEISRTMPTGEVIYETAGDDPCCDGYFQKVVEFIGNEHIDYQNELFCIYGDYITLYPDGSKVYHESSIVTSGIPALKLKLRGLLSHRSACYSRSILDKFEKVSEGRSYAVEEVQDDQLMVLAEKNYYLNACGSIYYAEIGVSRTMSDERKAEHLAIYSRLLPFLERHDITLDKKDCAYIRYRYNYLSYRFKIGGFGTLLKALGYYLISIEPSLGARGLAIDRLITSIKRRLKQ